MLVEEAKPVTSLNIEEIMKVLPHRYPLLLIDRIEELVPNQSCIGYKNVTMNEQFFQGHYPGKPIMPGVLILESMAQCGAMILLHNLEHEGCTPVIGAIDNVKFRKPVVPGDQLRHHVTLVGIKGKVGKISCVSTVDGQEVARMEMTFKLIPAGQA